MNTVVVIDDNQVNLALIGGLVGKLEGCRSVCFSDALRGMEWCERNNPDLVIVDYVMPEMNGIDFIRRFKAIPRNKEIPVIMVTASSESMVRYEALDSGANDFLNKPVDRIEFLARARNMLVLRNSQKNIADHAKLMAEAVEKATSEILAREHETVLRLCKAAECRDQDTGDHLLRIAHCSAHIAGNLGLSEKECNLLRLAAPMHDVGKIGTPDHILLKPGKLTAEEFHEMKNHTLFGHRILEKSESALLQAAAEIALSHHEQFDGSGYPHGLQGEDIPLFGRIVAVADVFDALVTVRPYKSAWRIEEAEKYLRANAGRHFDPACVDAFFKNWESTAYPVV